MSKRIEKNVQGRSTFQMFSHYLLVDIIPTLLMLAIMAFGMALISSKLTLEQFFTGAEPWVEKVS